jgi:GTP-binding protein HflX
VRDRTQTTAAKQERAILVGTERARALIPASESLAELARLADTAGLQVAGQTVQPLRRINAATFIGMGKVDEIRALADANGGNVVIFDDALSPAQQRNLETRLDRKVIDRSALILDIFAQRARSLEGKMQVELAQLQYLLPRLTRQWTHLSRLGGGVGTRGPGETQLEVDRRRVRERIAQLRRRLGDVERTRGLHRHERETVPFPTVALVGYTNSGKSTLMNTLTRAGVLVEDRLFATLDPTIRRLRLPEGLTVLLADTVGFIHKLPHQLVDAFRATLEEVNRADVLVEVVDAADPHLTEHRATVQTVLDDLGAGDKPRLVAYNKADLLDRAATNGGLTAPAVGGAVSISALTGFGLDTLRTELSALLASLWVDVDVRVPYTAGELLARVRERGTIDLDYRARDVRVRGRVAPVLAAELEATARAAPPGETNGTEPA